MRIRIRRCCEAVRKRKRELIEKECAGLIEFIETRHGLEAVGGNEHIKTELMEIARPIKAGDRARAPMGLLAVGAMGAGKTFVIKAFLKEAGLSGVALKNFRSKWVGSTESNLERVLATVKAMGPIALVIDEGDRSFGSGSEDSDGGTSSRVIARLKEFMSDPDNRGQVLFILMTNRPDKLDTDIKRPGRLDRKIPFFYAETAAERAAIVQAILRRYGAQRRIWTPARWKRCARQWTAIRTPTWKPSPCWRLEFAEREGGTLTARTLPPSRRRFHAAPGARHDPLHGDACRFGDLAPLADAPPIQNHVSRRSAGRTVRTAAEDSPIGDRHDTHRQ